jgi:hypothetical protein
MQIEIADEDAELLVKMLKSGKSKIIGQDYVMMRSRYGSGARSHVDIVLKERLNRIIALVETQVVLFK